MKEVNPRDFLLFLRNLKKGGFEIRGSRVILKSDDTKAQIRFRL